MAFYFFTIVLISFTAAFFSGLLGIGGGIIIFPSFLYLLPVLGYEPLTVNEITGVAATQALMGSFFAYSNHRKFGNININLVKRVIVFGLLGALSGSIISKFLSEITLLITYIGLLTVIVFLIIKPQNEEQKNTNSSCKTKRPLLLNLSVIISTTIAGSLGFGGAATFIPILNHFCKTPIKVAISTTTLIVFITTSVTFLGKAAVGLVSFSLIPAIILGSVIGAKTGTIINKKLPSFVLRMILLGIVVLTIIRIFITILEY